MDSRIGFEVTGELPPKKDGANSMWSKPTEIPRLIELRKAALAAMAGRPPLRTAISLELEIDLPEPRGQRLGDLDNFVTGVCDGLMAAHRGIALAARWKQVDCVEILPTRAIAIEDDDAVIQIHAQKRTGAARPGYRVVLSGS